MNGSGGAAPVCHGQMGIMMSMKSRSNGSFIGIPAADVLVIMPPICDVMVADAVWW